MAISSIADIFKIQDNFPFSTKELSSVYSKDISYIPLIVNKNTFIGIEIEMEKVSSISPGTFQLCWTFKGDGSLRNNGLEAVSYPLIGNNIRVALAMLYDLIPNVHFSNRTSIHIHLDVRHLTPKQLTAIILVYLSVESLLYKFVGKDRHENIFCVPLYTTSIVNSLVNLTSKASLVSHNFANDRYAGLNLDSIRKFGTLEFRQLHGTHDLTKIIAWINLIFKIYEKGIKSDLNNLIKQITELNTNSFYIAYLNDVFGEISYLLDMSEIKNDLEKGVKAVKQSIISNNFYRTLHTSFSDKSPAYQLYSKIMKAKHVTYNFDPINQIVIPPRRNRR